MKILHIGFPNPALGQAFSERSEYRFIDWGEWMGIPGNTRNFHNHLAAVSSEFQQDITFMQIQSPDVIDVQAVCKLHGRVVNWTWDYRCPTPQWMVDLAPYVLSLFTNENDVNYLNSLGFDADFLAGFDDQIYSKEGEVDLMAPAIVFMGNNYPTDDYDFPLAQYRRDMVSVLREKYGPDFGVYGFGWPGQSPLQNYMHRGYKEAACYRGCKIAINLSHFVADRYSSDRVLRILGTGAFCLSHKYPHMYKDFKDGWDLVTWDDLDDLINKIDYYLLEEGERMNIARNGCARSNSFTWERFVDRLIRKVKNENYV